MIFGRVKLAEARGAILAHNLKTADRVLRKGAVVDDAVYKLLAEAGYDEITVARLEPGDTPEGEAAIALGQALLTPGLRRSEDVHGRVNLYAEQAGLLRLNTSAIDALNQVNEAITLATLADRSIVATGDMIATLKIIPFAVGFEAMATATGLIAARAPLIALKPFSALAVGLVLTELPQLKDSAITQTIKATRARVEAHGGSLLAPLRTPHKTAELTAAIKKLEAEADVILISGASAVTDRQDVAPSAITAAGGAITYFGMPVDPGNLICFGELGGKHIIVLPGCARSPKLNGIDWVLDRIFAGEPVGPRDVAGMGVGGLLKEIEARPAPRTLEQQTGFGAAPKTRPRVAGIVLAAGLSSRMAPENKLLAQLPNGKAMIAEVVDTLLASAASPIIVVTGHQGDQIRQALAGRALRFVDAPDYRDGMAASLRAGVAALASSIGAALICLGDMPLLDTATLNKIIDAYDPAEGREIVLPVFDGQRGNPVLWGQRFFPNLLNLTGDSGARQILHKHMEHVVEIPVASDAILRDFDTKEALHSLTR
ncbi:MAG: 4-diphosphocytidyl-2C-methyl-D-erythritol kinase [Acidocella sp. 20-57-95]|nr:MAG: 4-diphosphocytidyl-2C-methyl-D-erythritol kinase [Acidocella sp. 20-57-95]HQT65104.1 molybdopterin-binding/glycosyltransferase family 2 protein [Acidocella sp.]HQU04103.1 molybdopterin-binding/glycosyltransferase family 2 protein [Acidocella sp.]